MKRKIGHQLLELSERHVTYEATLKRAGFAFMVSVPVQWTRLMNLRAGDRVKVTVESEISSLRRQDKSEQV